MIRRKVSVLALTLLLVGMLPIALNIPLVQADAGGTGKFLTIKIIGEGNVTATKVQSGETWYFYPADLPMTEKVGAGTVLLEPIAAEGYRFVEWIGDVNPDNTYKTEKYGNITAVFEELTYTITASAGPEGWGWINPTGAVSVPHGADITFWFGPTNDSYHISAIVVDGNGSQSLYAESYTFTAVTEDHTIHVAFSEEGTVSVPQGPGGNYFVDQYLFIEIGEVDAGGVILGSSLLGWVQEETAIGLYAIEWETAGAPTFEGGVVLALLIPEGYDPWAVRVIHGYSWQAIWCDVNNDLQVDSTDVSIVAKAIKFKLYYQSLDVNSDGNLTEADILMINENRGATLEDVTGSVVAGPDGLYFVTTIPLEENAHFRWK